MLSLLTKSQCQFLKRAWQDFRTVINSFPLSDSTVLLLFHANNLLDKVENSSIEIAYVKTVTERVNQLVATNAVVLDIDDMLKLINDALWSILMDETKQPVS